LTPDQFREWVAFFALEPWGPVQEDYRAGVLAARIHNAWFEEKADPGDFFPSLRESDVEPRQKTAERLKLKMMAITAAMGGTFQ